MRPAPPRYQARALIGAGAAAALALFACLIFYQYAAAYNRSNRDSFQISLETESLRPVDALIPRDATVGFLSDLPFEDTHGAALFFGAQYALAPRLLVDASSPLQPKWVVGVFSQTFDPDRIAATHRLRVFRVVGPGVAVFQREGG
jgi:hypothetical protein